MRLWNDRRPTLIVPVAAVLLAGCTTAVLPGGAILRDACGPSDGPAVELIVPTSAAGYPQLRVWVSRSLDELSGVRVTVPGNESGEGHASWCRTELDCTPAPATVAFGKVGADRSIDVEVDAVRADGTRVRDARRAHWEGEQHVLCG